MMNYPQLIDQIIEHAKRADLANLVSDLSVLLLNFHQVEWQQWVSKLDETLRRRHVVHNWQFNDEHIHQLCSYLYANELLVQCLKIAVVSDRQTILAKLLAPPQVDEWEDRMTR